MSKNQNLKWTEEQIWAARNVDLLTVLHGKYTFKYEYGVYYINELDRVCIQGCTYYDWYKGYNTKHCNSIDFMQQILGCTFDEAMEQLIVHTDLSLYNTSVPRKRVKEKKDIKGLAFPIKIKGQYKRAFAYLNKKRMIKSDLVRFLVDHKYLYQDTRGNCIFVWYNEKGEMVGADKQGTGSIRYKGICQCSDQRVGFNLVFSKDIKVLMFFESPVEMLSYMTLKRNEVSVNTKYISMSGCKDMVIEYHKQLHPDAKVVLCSNNDKAGKSLADKHKKDDSTVKSRIPKNNDDWNECLCKKAS